MYSGLSKHDMAGRDDGRLGHVPLEERTYCARQATQYMYSIFLSCTTYRLSKHDAADERTYCERQYMYNIFLLLEGVDA